MNTEHTVQQSPIVTDPVSKVITTAIRIHIFLVLLFHHRSWKKTIKTVQVLTAQIKKYTGRKMISKLSRTGARFYWDMYGVGWPSHAFVRNVRRESDRINASPQDHVGMRNVLFGITTKCPLQCEHCYEWNNLNIKERLSFSDLMIIIRKLIEYGVGQIHFGGGEPMMRFEEIIQLLKIFRNKSGFWIVTSGFQLTERRAHQLKEAGLTGVCVSLDHHEKEHHNAFRHHSESYDMAMTAVTAARKAGLVTSLSLCVTREYAHERNIEAYIRMGRRLGVSFIQFLEPRALGHYEGKDVALSRQAKQLLEDMFLKINTSKNHRADPIIIYHEHYKTSLGCRGGGNGAFYIDPLGEVHACPFCRMSAGSILSSPIEQCVSNLRMKGCLSLVQPEIFAESSDVLAS